MTNELQSLSEDLHKKLLTIVDEKKRIKEIYNFLYKSYILGINYCSNSMSKKDYKRIDEEFPTREL